MENLFNYITGLIKYYDHLVETEEAAELAEQEIESKTYLKDRCAQLQEVCINVHDRLFKTFDKDLSTLGGELSIELYNRNAKERDLLYAQIFDIINRFGNKVNEKNKTEGFNTELIWKKTTRINIKTDDGRLEKKDVEYEFSIAKLADDLCIKFNKLQAEIKERFKFSQQNKGGSKQNINGRAFALFCSIVHQCGILTKGVNSNSVYCNKVIKLFNLNAPIKSRQYFSESMDLKKGDKYLNEVVEKILPNISPEHKKVIKNFIDSKNLYG